VTYTPLTESERISMLATIGVPDSDALFSDVPPALRAPSIDLPTSLSELELRNALAALAASNVGAALTCFAGFGSYDHFIPCAVDALAVETSATIRTPFRRTRRDHSPERPRMGSKISAAVKSARDSVRAKTRARPRGSLHLSGRTRSQSETGSVQSFAEPV